MVDTTDRYPSNPGDPGAALEERLRRIEQELRAIQGKNPLNDAVFSGVLRNTDAAGNTLVEIGPNGLRMFDASGLLRVKIGIVGSGGNYGWAVYDANAGLRSQVDNDGHKDPWIPHAMIPAGVNTPVTSASFVPIYQGQVQLITHKGVSVSVIVSCPVGTTGEVRLRNADGGAVTSVVAIGSGAQVGQTFQWLHGSTLGGGPVRFDIEARRTSGAGDVIVYQPYTLAMADPLQCTSTGL